VLGDLPVGTDNRVLVDYRTSDDAGVYKLDAEHALVQTVDFFTPIVDDPFVYGQIAAANALSDVYAMGGVPVTALAIAGFPKDIDRDIIRAIFAGGVEMLGRAGVALLGGHTVQDSEVKFGYAVTGQVHPDRMWTNAGAKAGDELLLTKPLGTGVIATAIKFNRAPELLVRSAIASMTALNGKAAAILHMLPRGSVHACTDVTGFGLVGHASAMAAASGVTIRIDADRVPLFESVRSLAPDNTPGGGRTNAQYFGAQLEFARDVDFDLVQLLHDPQTSGGLLVAIDAGSIADAERRLEAAGAGGWRIGRVEASRGVRLIVG
jgi:selenide, water dikinase